MTVSISAEHRDDQGMSSPFSPMAGCPYAPYSSAGYAGASPGHRARVTGCDVVCTVALWVVLVVAAGTATWLSPLLRLRGGYLPNCRLSAGAVRDRRDDLSGDVGRC